MKILFSTCFVVHMSPYFVHVSFVHFLCYRKSHVLSSSMIYGPIILGIHNEPLTLSDPGYFRQLTIQGGGL